MTSSEVPETDLARIRRWCAARVPSEAAHQVRVVGLTDGPRVVIAEGDRFRKYARRPSGALEDLLEEIDADPTFVFWG